MTSVVTRALVCAVLVVSVCAGSVSAQVEPAEIGRVFAPDGSAWGFFGDRVAMGETLAIVVAANPAATFRVFRRTELGWIQDGVIALPDAVPEPAYQRFAGEVVVDGEDVVIGIPYGESAGVHVFRRVDDRWMETQTLPGPENDGTWFGAALQIDADQLVVGAPGALSWGRVHVYERTESGWALAQTLEPPDELVRDFGAAVATDRSTLVVGAPGSYPVGRAFVYVRTDDGWSLESPLHPIDELEEDARFGDVVAVSGDDVAVAAPSGWVGRVDTYRRRDGAWAPDTRLTVNEAFAWDAFGQAVVLAEGVLVAGAPYQTVDGLLTGAVYVSRRMETGWTTPEVLPIAGGRRYSVLGWSLAERDGRVAVGAPGFAHRGHGAGMVAVFDVTAPSDGRWPDLPVACPRYRVAAVISAPGDPTGRVLGLGLSDSGIVCGDYDVGVDDRAFVWSSATGSVELPFGDRATGVNAAGVVVGWEGLIGFVQDGERTIVLDPPTGQTSSPALAINDAGVVVGNSGGDEPAQAFRWTESGGFELLGDVLGGHKSRAESISPSGVIAGDGRLNDDAVGHGFVLDGDDVVWFPPAPGYRFLRTNGVNDDGHAVGYAFPDEPGLEIAPWHWDGATLHLLDVPDGFETGNALAIDDDGVIFGLVTADWTPTQACRWGLDRTPVLVGDLLPVDTLVTLDNAIAVDATGRVLANASVTFEDGGAEDGYSDCDCAVLLEPVPVPPSDLTCDARVDMDDLRHLLTWWGPCLPRPHACPGDLDGDGDIDGADVALLFDGWE